jgi:hypothetical protein
MAAAAVLCYHYSLEDVYRAGGGNLAPNGSAFPGGQSHLFIAQ